VTKSTGSSADFRHFGNSMHFYDFELCEWMLVQINLWLWSAFMNWWFHLVQLF